MEAVEQRNAGNVEFTELITSNHAAIELLCFSKNRWKKSFYPNSYKEAP